MIRAAVRHANSLPLLLAVWVVLSLCLAVSFLATAIERAAANDFRIANVDLIDLAGPVTTGSAADAAAGATAAQSPPISAGPSVRYGGTTWAMVGARLVPGVEQESGRPIVVAEVLVRNVTDDTSTRTRTADVSLVQPDGRRDPLDRFEFTDDPDVLTLQARQSQTATLIFKPSVTEDPVLAELRIEVAEAGRSPALLPLVGPPPEPRYPASGVLHDGVLHGVASPSGPLDDVPGQPPSGGAAWAAAASEGRMVDPIRLRGVVVDLDAGPYRAASGHQLVIVDAELAPEAGEEFLDRILGHGALDTKAPTGDSAGPGHGYWMLEVDGEPHRPQRIEVDPAGPEVTGHRLAVIFVVDEAVTDAIVVMGGDGESPARLRVSLPGSAQS